MATLLVPHPQKQIAYNASKAAVVKMTQTLACEWADRGVRVNCISPGIVNTALIQVNKIMVVNCSAHAFASRSATDCVIRSLSLIRCHHASIRGKVRTGLHRACYALSTHIRQVILFAASEGI